MDFTIRDLFIHLVKKYDIANKSHQPQTSANAWNALEKEFHDILENVVTIKRPTLQKEFRKWKDHPEVFQAEEIDSNYEVICEKIRKFKECAKNDPEFAAFLDRESDKIGKVFLTCALLS